MNLGVDFGSSYTVFARYDEAIEGPIPIKPNGEHENEFIPSVACLDEEDKDALYTGSMTSSYEGLEGIITLSAFKMLLNAEKSVWSEHGYTREWTPEKVAKRFLSDQLAKVQSSVGDENIENLVICVPEIWTEDIDNKATNSLLKICNSIVGIEGNDNGNGRVRVVTEPEAASAYAAYNYIKKSKKPFNGHLLIIDYGGGTLDNTLVRVNSGNHGAIEITVCAESGYGENHGQQVGNAGIEYMRKVTEVAVKEALPDMDTEKIRKHSGFATAVKIFENHLIQTTSDSNRKLSMEVKNNDELSDLESNNTEFCNFRFGRKTIRVTYSMLYQAYRDVVEENLKRELNEIKKKGLDKTGINSFTDSHEPNLKIALVGGFGNFCFVRKQVDDFFQIADEDEDPRTDSVMNQNRESAIALGAALVADGKVNITKTAPYSIGLMFGEKQFYYAIVKGQEMKDGEIYYIRKDPENGAPSEGVKPITYEKSHNGTTIYFATSNEDKLERTIRRKPTDKFNERIANAIPVTSAQESICIGFEMSKSGILIMRVNEWKNHKVGKALGNSTGIVLQRFSDLFGSPLIVWDWDSSDVRYLK